MELLMTLCSLDHSAAAATTFTAKTPRSAKGAKLKGQPILMHLVPILAPLADLGVWAVNPEDTHGSRKFAPR